MESLARPAGLLEDILERARRVPPVTTFPTVDELAAWFEALLAERPDLVERRRIGSSRLGEPLHAYRIGDGPRRHLLVAGVHPNEPIGMRTLQHLARSLVDDAGWLSDTAASWYLVPCIDPDGTRLNESWFANPSDRAAYFRGFYRPAPAEQVEWSFPFAYREAWFDRVLPETQALMRLIDDVRPHLLVSLHNAEFGGVYYYVSRAVPGIVDGLQAIPGALGLPLDTGEPESPAAPVLGTGVFEMIDARGEYDLAVALGMDPTLVSSGDSSAAYAARHGTVSLVAELPYWTDPACDDPTPTTTRYRDVLEAKAAGLTELGELLGRALTASRPSLSLPTPMLRAVEAFAPLMTQLGAGEARRAQDGDHDRPATVAEVYSNSATLDSFRLRFTGMALRALDAELVAGTGAHRLRAVRAELAERFEGWLAGAEAAPAARTRAEPIERLVGVQLAATLVLARLLADEAVAAPARAVTP